MSYPINTKFNPNIQPAMGLGSQPLNPVAPETLQQNLNSNPLVKTAKEDNPLFMLGMMLPIWFGISKGMDKFNAACRTQIGADGKETSLVHKVRDFGDSIQNKIIGKNQAQADKASGFIRNAIKTIDEKVVKKVSILNSIIHNPTKPEVEMVKMMQKGTLGELASDAPRVFETYIEQDPATMAAKLKKLGFESREHFDAAVKKGLSEDEIIKICRKVGPEEFVEFASVKKPGFLGSHHLKNLFREKLMGPELYDKTLGRKVYLSEMANKLEALKGLDSKVGTTTGKLLSKSMLRTMEGLTNATAGGKFAIAMQAFCFAQALAKTIDAPKGEKVKTFMENVVYDLSFYLLMPLGINLMHHAGGLKYIGLNKEQVAAYRTALSAFNDKVASGNMSAEAYKTGKKELVNMLKGDTKMSLKNDSLLTSGLKGIKNILHKPLKLAGRVLTVGLETIKPFQSSDGATIKNFFRRLPYNLKKGSGYPTRFLAYMMLIAPPLAAAVVKVPHAIFGKPTKSVLDEAKSEEKPLPQIVYPAQEQTVQISQQVMPQMSQQMSPQMVSQSAAMQAVQPQNNLAYTQQAQMMNANTTAQRTMIPTEDKKGPSRRYIPSSEGVKVTRMDAKDAKAMAMLQKSMISEKIANKQLG